MAKRNENIAKLNPHYLFPEIYQRKLKFQSQHPDAKIISLGIGDTTEPLPKCVTEAVIEQAHQLSTKEGYTGYGPPCGYEFLRQKIATILYKNKITPDEVFISDGSKCDIGRLQLLFGPKASIAIQDPAYPVYMDGSLMQGNATPIFMPCNPENNFFPDLNAAKGVDLIYFCSPNNPTGAAATREQLTTLVEFAKKNRSLIIFDSAYAAYIRDPALPKSIFEIDGAKDVAIETGSFSKIAGFTGIRLGWTVVPDQLHFEDGSSIKKDWTRVISTIFNGASILSQKGGWAILQEQGLIEIERLISFYMENAHLIKATLENKGLEVYGGDSAPYLWVRFKGRNSWDVFQELLENLQIVTTPGSGFGPSGEQFIRLTAFGSRETILEAVDRLQKFL